MTNRLVMEMIFLFLWLPPTIHRGRLVRSILIFRTTRMTHQSKGKPAPPQLGMTRSGSRETTQTPHQLWHGPTQGRRSSRSLPPPPKSIAIRRCLPASKPYILLAVLPPPSPSFGCSLVFPDRVPPWSLSNGGDEGYGTINPGGGVRGRDLIGARRRQPPRRDPPPPRVRHRPRPRRRRL